MTDQPYPAGDVAQLRRERDRQRRALEQISALLAQAERIARQALQPPPPAAQDLERDI
jgi:hypothetical protein